MSPFRISCRSKTTSLSNPSANSRSTPMTPRKKRHPRRIKCQTSKPPQGSAPTTGLQKTRARAAMQQAISKRKICVRRAPSNPKRDRAQNNARSWEPKSSSSPQPRSSSQRCSYNSFKFRISLMRRPGHSRRRRSPGRNLIAWPPMPQKTMSIWINLSWSRLKRNRCRMRKSSASISERAATWTTICPIICSTRKKAPPKTRAHLLASIARRSSQKNSNSSLRRPRIR